jgi:hypothetical protein
VSTAIVLAKKKIILLYCDFFLAKSQAGCHNNHLLLFVACRPLCIGARGAGGVMLEAVNVGS